MSSWSFWDWVGYSALFISAIIAAVDTAAKNSDVAKAKAMIPEVLKSRFWGYAPLFLLSIATLIFLAKEVGFIASSNNECAESQNSRGAKSEDYGTSNRSGQTILSPSQKQKLFESLSAVGSEKEFHVSINDAPGCPECTQFARELRGVAEAAGWKVAGHTPWPGGPKKGEHLKGINIFTKEPKPASSIRFAKALVEAGFQPHWREYTGHQFISIGWAAPEWEDYVVLISPKWEEN